MLDMFRGGTSRRRALGCVWLLLFSTLFFGMVVPPVLGVPMDDSEWVNLFNLTGIEDPKLVRLSPDGNLTCVVTDMMSYWVELWDTKNESMSWLNLEGSVTDVEFSPDGSMIAVGRGRGFASMGLVIYSSLNGSEIPGTHFPTADSTDDLDWSSDGSRIALGTWLGEIFIIDTTTWQIISETRFMDAGSIVSLAFSPDDDMLAFLASNGTCTILESETLDWVADLEYTTDNFLCNLSWSFDGRFLCSPYYSDFVAVNNVSTFSVEKVFYVHSASFSPTRGYLVIGWGGGSAEALDINDWQVAIGFGDWSSRVDLISWSGDGNSIALASIFDTTVRIFVDEQSSAFNHRPRVRIEVPGQGEMITSADLEFRGSAKDDGQVEFVIARIDDHAWRVVDGTTNWTWSPYYEELADGRHVLKVRAFDGLLFSDTCSTMFILDLGIVPNLPPWVSVQYPSDGFVASRPFPAYGFSGDDAGVDRIEITFANVTSVVIPDHRGFWEWNMSWEEIPEGSHVLSVRAFDGELWSPVAQISVVVIKPSIEPRPPRVSVYKPVNLEFVQGVVEFVGSAYPPEPEGIVVLEIDGNITLMAEGYSNWTCRFDTREVEPGHHQVQVWAYDGILPSPRVTMTIIVETYRYVDVLVDAPENHSVVRGVLNCTGRVVGTDVVYSVDFRVDQQDPITVNGTRRWDHELDTNLLEEGEHDLIFWATYAGGRSNVTVVHITVDNLGNLIDKPPQIDIIHPANGTRVEGIIRIEGTASDDQGIHLVELRLDSGEWVEVEGMESWHFDWNTEPLSEGLHRISVRAFDGTQYSEPTTHEYKVITSTSPWYQGNTVWIILIVILTLIVVVLYIRTKY